MLLHNTRMLSRTVRQYLPLMKRTITVSTINKTTIKINKLPTSVNKTAFELMDFHSVNRLNSNIYFGKDEFPNSQCKLELFEHSENIFMTDLHGSTLGYATITPSHLFLKSKAAYANVRIIPATKEINSSNSDPFSDLLKASVEQTILLNYEACIYEAFTSNIDMIRSLRLNGFKPIAFVPRSGNLFDMGWQDSVMFMKELKDIEVFHTYLFD